MTSNKPFTCRVGFHSWFSDTVFGITVRRCNYCPAVDSRDKMSADHQDRARALMRHYKDLPIEQRLIQVLKDMGTDFDPRK